MFNGYPDVLTVAQLQKALQIGRNTAYNLIASNEIKSLRIGKNLRIPKKHLLDYITNSCYNNDVMDYPLSHDKNEEDIS